MFHVSHTNGSQERWLLDSLTNMESHLIPVKSHDKIVPVLFCPRLSPARSPTTRLYRLLGRGWNALDPIDPVILEQALIGSLWKIHQL